MIEQIELITCGSTSFVRFRDKLETVIPSLGRTYYRPTNSSLERVVNWMNKMKLEVKKEGRTVTIVAWRRLR